MTSVVQAAMGKQFADLHPKVQWRFGMSSADNVVQTGTGVMDEMSHSPLLPPPFVTIGGKRGLFPISAGLDVPFTVQNYAYTDELGRETMAFVRRFQFPGKEGEMNSVMVTPKTAQAYALDYLGFSPDMVVHTRCEADKDGGLTMYSETPRFLLGKLSTRPPALVSALTTGREWWDEKESVHRIEIKVESKLVGRLFYYKGWFTAEQTACAPKDIPAAAHPRKVDSRE